MEPTITFQNGNEDNLQHEGLKALHSRGHDLEFYKDTGFFTDLDEIKDILGNDSFGPSLKAAIEKAEEIGPFHEYGLGFGFVEAGSFENQKYGYYRFQFSWGGPSEEIRFHIDGSIEFVYMDWFCGIGFDISDQSWATELKEFFQEIGNIDWGSLDPEQMQDFDQLEENDLRIYR